MKKNFDIVDNSKTHYYVVSKETASDNSDLFVVRKRYEGQIVKDSPVDAIFEDRAKAESWAHKRDFFTHNPRLM